MAEQILLRKRPQIDWGEMGKYAAQPLAARQSMYNELMPLLFKAQLESMMNPEERELKKAQARKALAEAGGLEQYYGGDSQLSGIQRPARTQEEALTRIPKGESPKDYYAKEDIKAGPLGIPEVFYSADLTPEAKVRKERTATKIAEANIAREIYGKDLKNFLQVDNILHQTRGLGTERFQTGINMALSGVMQNSPLGRAVAQHTGAKKRLRVQLVRAAGDVGNLNIVEQKAAEYLIPGLFDDFGTAELKRAYLQELTRAIDNNDGNAVKDLINKWQGENIYKQEAKITQVPNSISNIGGNKRNLYNKFREQGLSAQEARTKAGIRE